MKAVRRCPACKNKNLNYLPWLGQIYRCRKCGWSGVLALEDKKSKRKI